MTELDVVAWANATVAGGVAAGLATSEPISTLREPSLCNGRFLLDLLRSVEPRSVEPTKVLAGSTTEERVLNAKYAISCARKVGCMVFLLHEDIVEVKPKMLLVFVATLMAYCQKHPPRTHRRSSASEASSPKPRLSQAATGGAGAAAAPSEAAAPSALESQESTLGELAATSTSLGEQSSLGSLKVVEPRHGAGSSVHMSTSSVASDMSEAHMRVSQEYSASI